jgi:tetratricopeptide (TPR) repeat protein
MSRTLLLLAAVFLAVVSIMLVSHEYGPAKREIDTLVGSRLRMTGQAGTAITRSQTRTEHGLVPTNRSGPTHQGTEKDNATTFEGVISCARVVEVENLDLYGMNLSEPFWAVHLATEGTKYSLTLPPEISLHNIKSGALYKVVGVLMQDASATTQGANRKVDHLTVGHLELIKEYRPIDRHLLSTIKASDYPEATRLLIQGADASIRTTDYETPLHLLLKVVWEDFGRRAKGNAVHSDVPSLIESLIERGANVNGLDCWERTPLYYAVVYDFASIADLLITRGAHRQLEADACYVFAVRTQDEQIHDAVQLSHWISVQQDVPLDIQIWLAKARLLLRDRTAFSNAQAEQLLRSMLTFWPKSHEAWTLLAELSLRQGQWERSLDFVMRGLSHSPQNTSLLFLKARLEAGVSRIMATQTLRTLHDSDPTNSETVLLLANGYIAANMSEKAIRLLQQHLASPRNSYSRRCRSLLAATLYKDHRKSEAYRLFDELTRSDPNDRETLLDYIEALRRDASWERIRKVISEWAEANPDDIDVPLIVSAHLNDSQDSQAKVLVYDLLRRCEARDVLAGSVFEALLRQGIPRVWGDGATMMSKLAWLLYEEDGKEDEALDLAEKARRASPTHPDVLMIHGLVSCRLRQSSTAVEDFAHCVQYNPATENEAAAHFHLARVLVRLDRLDEAVMHLKRALDVYRTSGGLSTQEALEVIALLIESTKSDLAEVLQGLQGSGDTMLIPDLK